MPLVRFIIVLFLFSFFALGNCAAKVSLPPYARGFAIDTQAVKLKASAAFDSMMRHHPAIAKKKIIFSLMPRHLYVDKTADFYLLLVLFLTLGMVRFSDPRYFSNLWQSFTSPLISGKQMKEKLESATIQNMLMNLFFVFSVGTWLYYAAGSFTWRYTSRLSPLLLVSLFSLGVLVVYAGKYLVIRFSGWAFGLAHITSHYLFNVFFINKVLAISLLPCTVLIAFGTPSVASMGGLFSLLLVVFLFATRYMRSWQVFGSFFQYSKFHFLCTFAPQNYCHWQC